MRQHAPPVDLPCPACGSNLRPLGGDPSGPGAHRLACPACGRTFRARRRPSRTAPKATPRRPLGHWGLVTRGLALRGVEHGYRAGMVVGAAGLFALGGFATVIGGWIRDEIVDRGGVVEALGGVRVEPKTANPDADLGPAIARADAPGLFEAVADVARRAGVRPPGQVRLTYLPCCGVVAWGRGNRALVLGLPLLHVLTLGELRAVLAHELAHLARGDATRAADSARFVEALTVALDRGAGAGPLRAWALLCRKVAAGLLAPIARGQEARADRASAAVAGGSAAASALVKVAMVQPLFQEVLRHYDPDRPGAPNLYAFFRAFWVRLPEPTLAALRLGLITNSGAPNDAAHPPLPDRIAAIGDYPDRPAAEADRAPAASTLGDIEPIEQMLHNRLFGLPAVAPTVFHRAGT